MITQAERYFPTEAEKQAIRDNYPSHGLKWCVENLNIPERVVKHLVDKEKIYRTGRNHSTRKRETPYFNWSDEKVAELSNLFPHFGSKETGKMMGIKQAIVRNKACKMGLVLLPKNERLCGVCKTGYQYKNECTLCRECDNKRREAWRQSVSGSLKHRLGAIVSSKRSFCKKRSLPFNLTLEFLLDLYKQQNGLCAYSGRTMIIERKTKKVPDLLSIDQRNPGRGYTQDNVVLCTLLMNGAKNDFSLSDVIETCRSVVEKHGVIAKGGS